VLDVSAAAPAHIVLGVTDTMTESSATTADVAELPLADDVSQILEAKDLTHEDVAVPEWGLRVRLQVLTADAASEFSEEMFEESVDEAGKVSRKRKANQVTLLSTIVALCAVKANGDRLFSDREQVKLLGRKSSAALVKVAAVAMRLNGMTDEAKEAAKNDSSGTGGSATSSASPENSARPDAN
jgi:hypothetical protein